jgi:hypothetical protein
MALDRKVVFRLFAIGFVYWLVTFLLPFVLPAEAVVSWMTGEDSLVEYLTFAFLFATAILFIVLFFRTQSGNHFWFIHTKRNFIYLGLALVFLFGAGEEISWGQRILGFETPEELRAINEQEEFTVHNLPFFNSTNIGSLLQMNRLFLMFWFVFAIVIPLAARLSPRIHAWFNQIGMPIASFEVGVLLLIGYASSKFYQFFEQFDADIYEGRITEIRESQEALILMLLVIGIYILARQQASSTQELAAVKAPTTAPFTP